MRILMKQPASCRILSSVFCLLSSVFCLLIVPLTVLSSLGAASAADQPTKANLARPTPQQYAWQEQERIMFVCLDPCTWQGREYDNHSTPLSAINPTQLDTDQWCRAAKLWGAKEILFVAKHTGGFCWWQTETTKYGIKHAAWKSGKGDVLAELSASCRKQGLNLGIYVYPGDDTWDAPMGSGGRTKDPTKQEAYNKVFRQQLTEVLTRYGKIAEVWFDGSCAIDVSDILKQHAADAVIFQGPQATIRWPGTESGRLPYPAWNSLLSKDLKTGVATAAHGNPDGDAWAPLEADTTLYNHNWFWSAANEAKRKSLDELMDIYYKSAGRGGVLLLNSTPNTNGLIPDGDLKLYEAFGQEIERRFSRPVAEITGQRGTSVELALPRPNAPQSRRPHGGLSGRRAHPFVRRGRPQRQPVEGTEPRHVRRSHEDRSLPHRAGQPGAFARHQSRRRADPPPPCGIPDRGRFGGLAHHGPSHDGVRVP